MTFSIDRPNLTQSNAVKSKQIKSKPIQPYSTLSNPIHPNPIHLMQFNANYTTQWNQNRVDHKSNEALYYINLNLKNVS